MSVIEPRKEKFQPHPVRETLGSPVRGLERTAAREPHELRWPANPARVVYVDQAKLRDAGLLPSIQQQREMMDQYRAIKRPLLRAAFRTEHADSSLRLIVVTSALPGDGKTLSCVNLARSMAMEEDSMVLLVDGDGLKRDLSRVFGVEREQGLLELLADPKMPVESVILETTIPKLAVLPAGQPTETATELLASQRMQEVLQRLTAIHERGVILIDSPPVLVTSEGRVITAVAGQIVMIVRAGKTPQRAVKSAIEIIGREECTRLVLNQAPLSGPLSEYYGYAYTTPGSPPDTSKESD